MKVSSDGFLRVAKLSVLALAVLLSVLSIVALASRHGEHGEVSALIERYSKTNQEQEKAQDPKESKKGKSPQDEQVERIKRRNVFSPAKKKSFSAKLIGILGDWAIFAPDKLVKVGESVSGAKVTEIGPDWVALEYEGKPKKLFVFGSTGKASGPSPPDRPGRPSMPSGPPGMPKGAMVVSAGRSAKAMPPGFQVTPEMIEQFKKLTPEQREKALSRMPPEVRAKLQ